MKVKKKWKKYVHQITLACLLVCCVVQWMPKKTFASSFVSMDASKLDNNGNVIVTDGYNEHFVCQMQLIDISKYKTFVLYRPYVKEKNDFIYMMYVVTPDNGSFKGTRYDDNGKTYSYVPSLSGSFKGRDGETYRVYPVYGFSGGHYKCKSSVTATYGLTNAILNKYKADYDRIAVEYGKRLYSVCDDDLINNAMCWESGDTDELENEASKGALDNPIEDSEIGTIIIPKYRFQGYYRDSENENDCDFTFQWKNKTSTGFSLTKNKYAHTVIQCRVQSRCVVYKDLAHKQILKEFKNFGESAILYNSINVENNPYSIAYSYIKEKLPKTMKEIHNPLYVGYEYRFFFRVMCSDDLAVIPGDSGKWYSGGWRSVDLNASAKNEQNPNTSNGHFDKDDNWVTDKDDGNNSDDGGSTVSKDKDDARDDFANGDGKTSDSTVFDWNSFKGLINQCKEVPGLIKSIFSFLPDWVLVFIAIGFGIWIFVLIKRAIV